MDWPQNEAYVVHHLTFIEKTEKKNTSYRSKRGEQKTAHTMI